MIKWIQAQDITQQQQQQQQQQQENQEALATKIRADNLIEQLDTNRRPISNLFKEILTNLNSLKTHPDYDSTANLATLQKFEKFIELLKNYIEGASEQVTTRAEPLPELPPAKDEAKPYYQRIQSALERLKRELPSFFNTMKTIQQLLISAQEQDWIKQQPYPMLNKSFINAMEIANDLQLTPNISPEPQANVIASAKLAYPLTFNWKPTPEPVDLKQWKTLAKQIDMFRRAYKQYTFPQVLYHFTKDWDMFDRYKFKRWYKWTRAGAINKMKKQAQDYVAQDRAQQFQKKKKLLMSRIGLVRKALHDLIHNNLISKEKSGKVYKILAMLEYEALSIENPQITAARVRRSGKQLNKLGFTEGAQLLSQASQVIISPERLVKVAQEEANGMDINKIRETLSKIKDAMDKLNYGKHLDSLFYIKKDLEDLGRAGDAEAILKVIRDDLAATDKLNKKLTEIYTNLSRVPMELSTIEDKRQQKERPSREEIPIEVKEEELEIPKSRRTQPQQQEQRKQPQQEVKKQPAPKIDTNIPNV